MIKKERLEQLMTDSIGTEHYYKRPPFEGLVNTDGVINIQYEADMFWFVDMVGGYIPDVIKEYKKAQDGFFLVNLHVNKDHTAKFWICREVYEEGKYKYPDVVAQDIPYIDLPDCDLQFFLELLQESPIKFCLLCPSEH